MACVPLLPLVAAVVLFTPLVAAVVLREGVVVLGTFHPRRCESVAEFDAANAGNGENRMGDTRLDTVPERFAEADRKALDRALDDAAERVAVRLGHGQRRRPLGRIRKTADFDEVGMDTREMEQFPGDNASRHDGYRHPSAERPAAAGVVEAAELEAGREVGMAGTGILAEGFVILTAGILIIEKDGQGGTGRAALVDAADDVRNIGFLPGGSAPGTCFAALQVLREIFWGQGHAGKHAVNGHADGRAVGCTENRDAEFVSESIHLLFIFVCALTTILRSKGVFLSTRSHFWLFLLFIATR